MKQFYSVSDVAARFEVTSQTVRNWIAAGQLQSVQATPGGRYKIPAQTLLSFEQASGLLTQDGMPLPGETQLGGSAGKRPVHQHQAHRAPLRDAEGNPADGPSMKTMASTHLGEPVASELTRVVRAIVASVQPDGVILFGSRARGDFRADSDFDLAILAPDGIARRRIAMRAYESLANVSDRTVAVDIVVLTRSIIATERDLTGSIARAVSREGVILYGSPAALA
jgi:excisionase family DNA binding protein